MMRKTKMQILLLALAISLTTYFSQETLAYYTVTGNAVNAVSFGTIQLQIHEQTAAGTEFPEKGVYVEPGDVVSKQVAVENVCRQPFYLRVKLINGIEKSALPTDDIFKININTEDWTLHEDGYIYYNRILQPEEISTPVFTEVKIVGDDDYRGETLLLTVTAHATQSKNNPAENPWDAAGWPEN